MKFNIGMVHLQRAVMIINVKTDGSVVVTCGTGVLAQFADGSVEQQPLRDMELSVFLQDGERINIEVSPGNIEVMEYGGERTIAHPSYQDVRNTAAREFATKLGCANMSNRELDVVREALNEVERLREEVEHLTAELKAKQVRPKWSGKT